MNFEYSEEQNLFSDSLRKLLENKNADANRRKVLEQEDSFHSEALWQNFADFGLLGIPFDEKFGGFGGSAIDVMIAEIEFGKHLSMEPYLASVILGGAAVRLAGSEDQKLALIAPMIAGELKLACAFGEPQSRHDFFDVETRAKKSGDSYKITGAKAVVIGGDCADNLIVSARTSGGTANKEGLSLFIVDASAESVSKRAYRLTDGRGAAEVWLDDVSVSAEHLLGKEGNAWPVISNIKPSCGLQGFQ